MSNKFFKFKKYHKLIYKFWRNSSSKEILLKIHEILINIINKEIIYKSSSIITFYLNNKSVFKSL